VWGHSRCANMCTQSSLKFANRRAIPAHLVHDARRANQFEQGTQPNSRCPGVCPLLRPRESKHRDLSEETEIWFTKYF
jgi:hypothetical protein